MSYYIFKNDSTSIFEMKNTYGDGNFTFNEEVSAGDTIDFMVGLGSNGYYCGNIPIHTTITLTPDDSQADNSQQGNGSSNSSCRFVVGSLYYEVDGVPNIMDAAPYIDQGRTFVPITYVARALGIDIAWDGGSQSATLSKGAMTVQIQIGSNTMQVNGLNVTMYVSPQISNGRTCLPISPVCQAFGKKVSWYSATQTININ
ncbi:MAG: copper amine oxidase N-terminal domain-containing protein [Syntrophomonadaceae bacterium]